MGDSKRTRSAMGEPASDRQRLQQLEQSMSSLKRKLNKLEDDLGLKGKSSAELHKWVGCIVRIDYEGGDCLFGKLEAVSRYTLHVAANKQGHGEKFDPAVECEEVIVNKGQFREVRKARCTDASSC